MQKTAVVKATAAKVNCYKSGIFHKVYNVSLSTAWNDFYEAIPLPEDLELMEELENVLDRLKDGKPVLCEVPKEIKCDGIVCTTVYLTTGISRLR